MKDAATSPQHPHHHVKQRVVDSLSSIYSSRQLLTLPIEVVGRILEEAIDCHPTDVAKQKTAYDPRDHAWQEYITLEIVAGYAKAYHEQVFKLLTVCRAFYLHLLPRLYARPILVSPRAIASFADNISLRPLLHDKPLASMVQHLALQPASAEPSNVMVQAWKRALPVLLPKLSALRSLDLGLHTLHLPLDEIAAAIPEDNKITSLDHLDHFPFTDSVALPADRLHSTLSLLSRCPQLKRLSIGGINLLEQGHEMHLTTRAFVLDDEEGEWSGADSVAERFLQILKMGVTCGSEGEEEGGLESLMLWDQIVMGVGVFDELLRCLPRLRCLHIDVFTYFAPSSRASTFYDPATQLFSLPALFPLLVNLVEFTFGPVSGNEMIHWSGNFDEMILHLPHLLRLELRADFITPLFFQHALAPSAAPITYLALHIFPPFCPPYRSAAGIQILSVLVCVWKNRQEVVDLAERAGEVFVVATGKGVEWPTGMMEEGRDVGQGGWYEMLVRLSSLAIRCRGKPEEYEGEWEEDDE